MKYTREERLVIGRQIYDGEFSVQSAAEEYDISFYTARVYLRMFKAQLQEADPKFAACGAGDTKPGSAKRAAPGMNLYRAHLRHLTREQLENELVEMKQREEQIRQLLK